MTTMAPVMDTPSSDERLGAHLRGLRKARGLTLTQLAEAATLSHPFLSQLERGLARPSMASLERLARALGTSRVELLAGSEPPRADYEAEPSFVAADEGVIGPYAEGTARLLAEGPRRFEPLEFTGSNPTPGDHYVHEEDEFLTVLEGSIVISFGGFGERTLRVGDSVYCRSGTPHRWHSPDGSTYRLLIVKELVHGGGADDAVEQEDA
ncbi:transcriptional regulator with XRE-family HTH domain [Microbacterium sp. 1154]|uniref:helix-turn-helix domain-containing protein n=1 Tax=Microbacterium sp. 1154 TaxID=2817733 RepID=UPI002855583F|nr:helix-turn-helix domain-containing protein [Microbacterium sp. 1154]MDR6689847.1 transcriptional regulator with XRE-family HTH domain [Microbacterium sp. 1154]